MILPIGAYRSLLGERHCKPEHIELRQPFVDHTTSVQRCGFARYEIIQKINARQEQDAKIDGI
mgnify:CR=1 FL=1